MSKKLQRAVVVNVEEQKYRIPNLEEYIRQSEPVKQERGRIWQAAIGLQQVDGLHTSDYLLETARQHIEGDITIRKANELIDSYYQSAQNRHNSETEDTEEADKVSARIAELLSERAFTFNSTQLTAIHKHLFSGIYKFAGRIRDYNITKHEWVLNGESVFYASADVIRRTLEYDFEQERAFNYSSVAIDVAIEHLARFCSNIWQIHPFGEGNTRTTAVFMIKYLRTLGFNADDGIFAENSWFFRNALVRANYSNVLKNIGFDTTYIVRFFRNMLLDEKTPLLNRELHVDWNTEFAQSAIQSAKTDENAISKCKNCTLEELAVLKIIAQKPNATQKEIAEQIGKSERTVKSLTVRLAEQGVISRENGKRNGFWVVKSNQ